MAYQGSAGALPIAMSEICLGLVVIDEASRHLGGDRSSAHKREETQRQYWPLLFLYNWRFYDANYPLM